MRWTRAKTRVLAGAVLAVSLVTTACHGDHGGPAGISPSIEGDWAGSAYLGALSFSATFDQQGDAVTGTGTFSTPSVSGPFLATGTVSGSAVELTLASQALGTAVYHGRFVAANRITGTLDAAAYGQVDLTLDRK